MQIQRGFDPIANLIKDDKNVLEVSKQPLWGISTAAAKLYIPSTIINSRKLLTKAIWQIKNGLVSFRLACTSIKLKIKKIIAIEIVILNDLNHGLIFYCSHNPL
jgi:hypothetical protein